MLGLLYAQGYLTQSQYENSLVYPMPKPDGASACPRRRASRRRTSRTTSRISSCSRFGPRRTFGGGLRVTTTLDVGLQQIARDAIKSVLPPSGIGPTAALVVLDAHTGAVLAMVGGENYHKNQFNLATQGERQPGSSFKPFVLATALKENIAPSTRARLAAGDDQRRRPALEGQQLRGRVPRADRPDAGDRVLRQLGLLAADGDRRAAQRARHREARSGSRRRCKRLLRDRARRRAGDAARDGTRLRVVRRRRQAHRRLDLRQPAARRQRDQGRRQDAGQQRRREAGADAESQAAIVNEHAAGRRPVRHRQGGAAARAARSPARPARPRTTATPGSSATRRSSSPPSGSATPTSSSR